MYKKSDTPYGRLESTYPYNTKLPSALLDFHGKLMRVMVREWPALDEHEAMWVRVFRDVAAAFETVPTDASYSVSFDTLVRCYREKTAGSPNYLWKACRRAHLDFLEQWKPLRPRQGEEEAVEHDWRGIDQRLDLEATLVRMRRVHPDWERAVSLRLRGTPTEDIASELGISKRHVDRVLRKGEQFLQSILGGDE